MIKGVVPIVNSLLLGLLKVLGFFLGIGYSQQNFFNHGLPNFINFCSPYISQFKVYLSYLMYFVPKQLLITLIGVVLAVTIVRIVLAIVNLVWW